jgi:hypothetical protein
MKSLSVMATAIVVLSAAPDHVRSEDTAELTAYIESIRASGMTEGAQSSVRMVAGILAGATLLTYRPDPESGQYWASYMSTSCPNPNADPPELNRWKKMKIDESGVVLQKLGPFADMDKSGFVTSNEGHEFRYLLEFGYLASQALRDGEASVATVARAYGQDASATQAQLRKYVEVSTRITNAGIEGLPEISIPGTEFAGKSH